ncbi:MAG TPA: hypothetical protein VEV45_00760 [Streptosporangiaceae bacterium]|nr:hypothetical protein [Streptosporangiaceae bacterium]
MAIAALILWLCTAGAGLSLLRAGTARRRASAPQLVAPAESPAEPLVRIGAVPLTAEGKPPPGPHARVSTPAGEHPLLEFTHPALATTGVACWLMFTFVHYRPFAWISFAVLVTTLLVGLSWYARNRQAALRKESGSWSFPPRLIALHGAAAALSITLTVVTALVASHG